MQARILFLTDLHKRDTDFTTITGYTQAIDCVQEDILATIKKLGVTHVVIGGDWYDKGYRSINRTFNDMNYDKLISDSVNGNVYICRGNHLYLERDSNPEMYLIQPCEAMPPIHPIKTTEEPLFKSPDVLQIGPLQISLFHFDKSNKSYYRKRNPETKFHIGVFHDDCVLPSSVRAMSGDHSTTSTIALANYYENLDLAVCNHIHMAVGLVRIAAHDKEVPAMIPGSLCITKNKTSELHSSVNLPVITLEDDDSVKVQTISMSLHTELLKLYDKKETKRSEGGRVQLEGEVDIGQILSSGDNMSFKDILIRKGYKNKHLQMLDTAATTGLTVADALVIHLKEVT